MRFGLLYLLIGASVAAQAAAPLTRNEQTVINFGFATQLGSGVYSLSGRTLQVYKLPFNHGFPAAADARVKVRITLPVTIGFIDFKPRDVIDNGLPQGLDSLSIVPGLEFDVAMRDGWLLQPFIEAGVARDRTNELDQRVYAAGLRSYFVMGRSKADWQLYNELIHVVVEQQSPDSTDDFTRFRTGVTARRPFDVDGVGRRADFVAYGFVDLFTDAPAGPASERTEDDDPMQFEVGVSLGATERWRLWGIPLPRVGLGYRFGEGLSVYRLVLGSPY
jgi:hypothetical protein